MKRAPMFVAAAALAASLQAGTALGKSLDREGTGEVIVGASVTHHKFTTVEHGYVFDGMMSYPGGNNVWNTSGVWKVPPPGEAWGQVLETTRITTYAGGPGVEQNWSLTASCNLDPWIYPDEAVCNLTGYAGDDPCAALASMGVDCQEYFQIPLTAKIIAFTQPEGTLETYRAEAAAAPPPAPPPPAPCSPFDDVVMDEPTKNQYVLSESRQFKVVVHIHCLVQPDWKYEKQSFEVDFEWFDTAADNGAGAWIPQTGLLASMPMVKNVEQALTFGTKTVTLPQKGKWRMHARSQWWWDNPPKLKPGGWSEWREFWIGRPAFFRESMTAVLAAVPDGEEKHGPDLTIGKYEVIVVNPGDQTTDGTMTYKGLYFTWTVQNIGDGISNPTQLQVTCTASPTGLPCPPELNHTWEIGQLWPHPNDPSGAQVVWNSPAIPFPSLETRWTLHAKVDPQKLVAETQEYNNSHVDTYSPKIYVPMLSLEAFKKVTQAQPQASIIGPQGIKPLAEEGLKPVTLTPLTQTPPPTVKAHVVQTIPAAKAPVVAATAATAATLLVPNVRAAGLSLLPAQPLAGKAVFLVVRLKNEGKVKSSAEQKFAVACKVVGGGPACAVPSGEYPVGKAMEPGENYDVMVKGEAAVKAGTYEISVTPAAADLKPLTFTVKPVIQLPAGAVQETIKGSGGTVAPAGMPNKMVPSTK